MLSGDYLHFSFLSAKMSQIIMKKYKAVSADNRILVKY